MPTKEKNEFKLSVKEMAEVGLHFGHKRSKIHPRMEPYLYGIRNTIYIINLDETKEKLEEALKFMQKTIEEGKVLLVVGTRIQSKEMVKEFALAYNLPYVNERWIGGTFTNFEVIRKRIDYFKGLKEKREKGELEKYTKKEKLQIIRELKDLEKKFGGIEDLGGLPEAVFVLSMKDNDIVVKEAREKGIKVVGIADADANPLLADYPIPANDDSLKGMEYILGKAKEAILEAKSRREVKESSSSAESDTEDKQEGEEKKKEKD